MTKQLFLSILLLSACSQQNELQETQEEIPIKKKMTTSSESQLQPFNGSTLLFYNVENLFDTKDDHQNDGDDDFLPYGQQRWDDERYQEKLKKLAKALQMTSNQLPTIAGFCEIENYQVLEDLVNTEDMASIPYKIVHYNSPGSRGIDVGFIYDSSKFKVNHSEKIPVTIKDEPDFTTRDILYIAGEFAEGKIAHFFVNHWSSRREGQEETEYRRVAAAKILRSKIDALQKEDQYANIVIMGDFNDTPLDKSLTQILKAKPSSDKTNASELSNLMHDLETADKGTIKFKDDWMVFDQLIVSRSMLRGSHGLKVKNGKGIIVSMEELLYRYKNGDSKPNSTYGGENYYGGYSDHLPVYFVLEEGN